MVAGLGCFLGPKRRGGIHPYSGCLYAYLWFKIFFFPKKEIPVSKLAIPQIYITSYFAVLSE